MPKFMIIILQNLIESLFFSILLGAKVIKSVFLELIFEHAGNFNLPRVNIGIAFVYLSSVFILPS